MEMMTLKSFGAPSGRHSIVDGIVGLHVDDYVGAGEGVQSLADLKGGAT